MTTLLNEISSIENLNRAFYQCLRGKRRKPGAQKVFFIWGELILKLQKNLLAGENYPWADYRQFWVTDPKRRLISSAPFLDRVAHRAIHNVIYPRLAPLLISNSYACRENKGNGKAVRFLMKLLKDNPGSYVIKMDVKKFFNSINQYILFQKLKRTLPDDSLSGLIIGLLKSHPDLQKGKGLPLGNLTSQIFANFYLNDIDQRMQELTKGRYIRYMDDLLIFADTKEEMKNHLSEMKKLASREQLEFPQKKRAIYAPGTNIPFLGFLVNAGKAIPLNRNKRMMMMKLKEKVQRGDPDYRILRSVLSYNAWMNYPNSTLADGSSFCGPSRR